jgi:hypothetical protein
MVPKFDIGLLRSSEIENNEIKRTIREKKLMCCVIHRLSCKVPSVKQYNVFFSHLTSCRRWERNVESPLVDIDTICGCITFRITEQHNSNIPVEMV